MYEILILKEGYSKSDVPGCIRADGTITLLKGENNNIMVDTGSPWDKDIILKGLSYHNLSPDDIQYVVCSHGHSDHVGNLNLFTKAVHIVSFNICIKDQYILHEFSKGIPYEIDDDVEVWPTPGHTGSDVSVIVKNTNLGTVAVVGDLFECEADLKCPTVWTSLSERPDIQEKFRISVLKAADYILPGHGPMFQVPKDYKEGFEEGMPTEELSDSSDCTSSQSECIVEETD